MNTEQTEANVEEAPREECEPCHTCVLARTLVIYLAAMRSSLEGISEECLRQLSHS